MLKENIQTVAKVSKRGKLGLNIYIPRQDMHKFKPGDIVVIIKGDFVPASKLKKS
jgi:hypothetical protein